jgi:hypothetical protein
VALTLIIVPDGHDNISLSGHLLNRFPVLGLYVDLIVAYIAFISFPESFLTLILLFVAQNN